MPRKFSFSALSLKKILSLRNSIFFSLIYHFRKLTNSDKGVLDGRGVGMDINVGVTLPNLLFLGEISNQPLNG